MDIIYTIIPNSKINTDLLTICSNLFSNHYGIWSSKGVKPGERVKMGIQGLKKNCCFDNNCGVVIAKLNDNTVGHAFFYKFYDEIIGKICWITQLVVDTNVRNRGIAKNLIHNAFDPDCCTCGLVTSHPYAIRSLEKATGYKCVPEVILYLTPFLLKSNIPYILNKTVSNTTINTEFFVDHTNVLKIIEEEKNNNNWVLGDLPEGYEYFAFIKK
jgi:hypothetical protein